LPTVLTVWNNDIKIASHHFISNAIRIILAIYYLVN